MLLKLIAQAYVFICIEPMPWGQKKKRTGILPYPVQPPLWQEVQAQPIAVQSATVTAQPAARAGTATIAAPQAVVVYPKIQAVSAAMLAGEYRSVSNYISAAKDEHFRHGYPWGTDLIREAKLANRACNRGLGPSHQCAELSVPRAWEMAGDDPLMDSEPLGTPNVVVICAFFLLREIEYSLLLVRCVMIDYVTHIVSILLPASKTDPGAHSTTRSWGCVCKEGAEGPCPYHAAVDQMTLLRKQFPSAVDLEDLPFFPTKSGAVVSKDGFAKWVVRLAVACEAARTEDPASEFAGHVWRICGSGTCTACESPFP